MFPIHFVEPKNGLADIAARHMHLDIQIILRVER